MTIHVANCKLQERRAHANSVVDRRARRPARGRRRHCVGVPDREAARYLRTALFALWVGAWRRERVRSVPAASCGHAALLWALLTVRDHGASEMTIRHALAIRDPESVGRFAF
jgi:hypothetical protein